MYYQCLYYDSLNQVNISTKLFIYDFEAMDWCQSMGYIFIKLHQKGFVI